MKSILEKIRAFVGNKWFKFVTISICYLLWVFWMANFWLLFGLAVIFDMYITKKVPWAFWKLCKPKSRFGKKVIEWIDAIIFAVIAASFIRLFFFEAYTIPTSSMEKSLLIGDYLFVSKYNYGPRLPNTPLSFPFVHHTLPLTRSTPSFLTWIQNDYVRKPGLEKIKNDDVVVFNFPEGDTVIVQQQEVSYYQVCREIGRDNVLRNYDITYRPADKQENYIKRCVGIPGDSILIVDAQLYVNGKKQNDIDTRQFNYLIVTNGTSINPMILDEMEISNADRHEVQPGVYIIPMTVENAKRMKELSNVVDVKRNIRPHGEWAQHIFPHDSTYKWNEDFFGPLYIPKKGATIALSTKNLSLYERVISCYEHNTLKVEGDKIFINGKIATSYTFKMDYYWMMGDNRHNSADSRFWGFVPEDHIVGKASLVWLSIDQEKHFPFNIRWNRIMKVVHD
jgi:signal peptidase I